MWGWFEVDPSVEAEGKEADAKSRQCEVEEKIEKMMVTQSDLLMRVPELETALATEQEKTSVMGERLKSAEEALAKVNRGAAYGENSREPATRTTEKKDQASLEKTEEALVKWLKAARSKNLPISGPLLVEKALVFASQLNHDNFVCSNGWLARLKAKHGITRRTVPGEGAAADVDGAEQWRNGIIRAVKQLYKKNLLRRFLLAIECGKLFSIDLIGAIHLLEYLWRQVEATTVRNCFKRAGFSVCAGDADDASDTMDQTSDIVDEACKTLLTEVLERQGVTEGISFPNFRDADSNVQTSPDMFDEAIVASVVEVSQNDSDEDDMESDNTGDPGPIVAEASHCVSVMRVFAEKRGLAEKLAHSISELEAAVVAARLPRRQIKITDFVTRSK
ncbi:hypothetical protein HPB51_009529 [Rhipicephalus microplus]|uniref:HTH CENPB-type domain-containing protein n=1 Tax=Rhipicephalus microplus TaxID=6941 RepID=A0A9J6F0X2_RHIMP|nr:hypothetical protein HPB51_009529 [Rhipicephalus microplus]